MGQTTHYIEVTQGPRGRVIDKFTIELDDGLDVYEQHRIFNEEARRRLEERSTVQSLDS
tara:strand:+ start:685 stop:861 length:177 start_codon:yes stop_codon:yes gene_type:complete